MAIYETKLVTKRKLSARDYLQTLEKQPNRAREVQFVPPKIGSKSFGHFEVSLNKPLYEVSLGR